MPRSSACAPRSRRCPVRGMRGRPIAPRGPHAAALAVRPAWRARARTHAMTVTGGHTAPFALPSDDLQQCIRCGMCLQACPTYLLTGLETESPRGRIHLMDALAKGRAEATDRATLHLDRCLGCRACEAVCPSGVVYGKLIELTRAEIATRRPSRLRDLALRGVLARPRVLGLVAAVGSLYERLGIRALLH